MLAILTGLQGGGDGWRVDLKYSFQLKMNDVPTSVTDHRPEPNRQKQHVVFRVSSQLAHVLILPVCDFVSAENRQNNKQAGLTHTHTHIMAAYI